MPTSLRHLKSLGFLGATLPWLVTYFAARGLLEAAGRFSPGVRVLIAVMPVPFFAFFLFSVIRSIRSLDELERRMHLEALAVAFPLTMLFLQTLGLLQRAITLPFEDWSYSHVWAYLPIFYFLGLAVANRRYQ